MLLPSSPDTRPKLAIAAVRRWLPWLVRRSPYLATGYLVPGRVDPRLREATMLGVTSVNQCVACQRVHERWGAKVGLPAREPETFPAEAAAAYRYGQALAALGPQGAFPAPGSSRRHRHSARGGWDPDAAREPHGGNRFLPERDPGPMLGAVAARLYDLGMRLVESGRTPSGSHPHRVRGPGRRPGDRRYRPQPGCVSAEHDAARSRPQQFRPHGRREAGSRAWTSCHAPARGRRGTAVSRRLVRRRRGYLRPLLGG